MLRTSLIESDRLFGKFKLDTVAVFPLGECCAMSGKTNDDIVYVYSENIEGKYDTNVFGFRNWESIHSIISSLYNEKDEESFKLFVETDESTYPNILHITTSIVSLKYFVQNYTFISSQENLKALFDKKKFKLDTNILTNAKGLNDEVVKYITRLSAFMNEKYFRIKEKDGNGYLVFGNENQSTDNGVINIGKIDGINTWREDMYFSTEYFTEIYRSMSSDTLQIRLSPTQIAMKDIHNGVVKVAVLRGKTL